MRVVLRPHLKVRLKERLIPNSYPKEIATQPDSLYSDQITGHKIAVKDLLYNEKTRPMAIAYDIIGEQVEIITIYPTTAKDINSKVKSKRWLRL